MKIIVVLFFKILSLKLKIPHSTLNIREMCYIAEIYLLGCGNKVGQKLSIRCSLTNGLLKRSLNSSRLAAMIETGFQKLSHTIEVLLNSQIALAEALKI